jgi:hypothetical protein
VNLSHIDIFGFHPSSFIGFIRRQSNCTRTSLSRGSTPISPDLRIQAATV